MNYECNYLICIHYVLPGRYIIVVIAFTRSMLSVDINQPVKMNDGQCTIRESLEVFRCFCLDVVFGESISHKLICGINFMPCTWHESRYIQHSSNCHNMFGHIFREYIHKHMTFIFQFSARVSDYTNIINGLNTDHGYQSCVRYMAYDVWRKIYLWEYELDSLFPIKPTPPLMRVFENLWRKYITC